VTCQAQYERLVAQTYDGLHAEPRDASGDGKIMVVAHAL